MIRDFARAVTAALENEIEAHAADCANGRCKSFDEYKHLCGLIRGLRLAEEKLNDLAKRAQTHDDDDDQ